MSLTEEKLKEFNSIASKVCSMMIGIPMGDIIMLRDKHDKVHSSVLNTLKILEEECRDEPDNYKKFLFSSYFDSCFEFLQEKEKVDAIMEIMSRMVFKDSKEQSKVKLKFFDVFKKELDEVRKNRGQN